MLPVRVIQQCRERTTNHLLSGGQSSAVTYPMSPAGRDVLSAGSDWNIADSSDATSNLREFQLVGDPDWIKDVDG